MAYETLHEAAASSPQCAVQMFCSVRNMFELFCNVFPTYHKQSLETLPQFTGIVIPVLSGHSKRDKTKVLTKNGSLMKVESIAECSLGSFCNTFDLH